MRAGCAVGALDAELGRRKSPEAQGGRGLRAAVGEGAAFLFLCPAAPWSSRDHSQMPLEVQIPARTPG